MRLWLLVPVKPFGEGKSRLAQALSVAARADLSQRMLARVLQMAEASAQLAGILVVSRDPDALTYAQRAGVQVVRETGTDLNAALTQASQQAVKFGAEAILVLPADLPLVTGEDIRQLAILGQASPSVVLTRSPDGGTNALLLHPPGLINFGFGPASFDRHRHWAQAAGATVQLYQSATLSFDVDWPEDLATLRALYKHPDSV